MIKNKALTKSPYRTALDLIERLAGSVKIPSRFKRLSSEEIVGKAKKENLKKEKKPLLLVHLIEN